MEKASGNAKTNEEKQLNQRQRAFIEHQNNCPLCGGQLAIKVETYLADYTLREEAVCEHCEVLARVKDHQMQ